MKVISIEPFIYQDPTKKFYIIQNVNNSGFSKAINVAYHWYASKINYGFDSGNYVKKVEELNIPSSPGIPIVFPSHVIYGISSGNILEPIRDNRNGDPNFLQLLNYNDNQFAAMLPL